MQLIRKSIDIEAPVGRVFAYVTEPKNLPTIMSSLVEVTNVQQGADGGFEYDWVYKMLGVRLHGHSHSERLTPNEYVEMKVDGGIRSTFRWRYEGRGAVTRVSVDIEYTIPAPVIGKLAEVAAAKVNEREAESMLSHLKAIMEATARSQPTATAPS